MTLLDFPPFLELYQIIRTPILPQTKIVFHRLNFMKLNYSFKLSTSCGFKFTLFLKVIHKVGITREYPYFSAITKDFYGGKACQYKK